MHRAVRLVVAMALCLTACQAKNATVSAPAAPKEAAAAPNALNGTMRVAVDEFYPPFGFSDSNGGVTGFDIDVAQALCDRMGQKCTFVAPPFETLIMGLKAGKYDAIVASIEVTDVRKTEMAFSDPYYRVPAFLAGPSGKSLSLQPDGHVAPEGLAGLRIGVEAGLPGEAFAKRNFPKAEVKPYAGFDGLTAALKGGEVDLVFDGRDLLENETGGKLGSSYQLYGRGYIGEGASFDAAIAVRKGDTARLEAFNVALRQIEADGTIDRIAAKYFPFPIFAE